MMTSFFSALFCAEPQADSGRRVATAANPAVTTLKIEPFFITNSVHLRTQICHHRHLGDSRKTVSRTGLILIRFPKKVKLSYRSIVFYAGKPTIAGIYVDETFDIPYYAMTALTLIAILRRLSNMFIDAKTHDHADVHT